MLFRSAVKWRGSWVEVEGKPDQKAETINPNLPGYTRQPVLKAGGSVIMAIGEPLFESESGRWRYGMRYVPNNWRERWFDFSVRHKLPNGIGPIVFVDARRLLNPTNFITVTTSWLTK